MGKFTNQFVLAFMAIVFIFSGLIINTVQAFLYVILYNTNRNLYRKMNYYLIYTCWSQILGVAEWWSGLTCNLYGKEEDLKRFGREHSIAVTNHKYEIDWLMCWFVCDKLRMLGNAKTCAKKSLKHVPIMGWCWVFAEMVFLERNWEKDRLTLGAKLDKLIDYKDPIMLLLFCEGTRFTPEKHEASMKFAKEHNLPELKHHLLPRAKGFNFSAAHLKTKTNAIYDVEIAFPKDSPKPSFSDLLRGKKFAADMYIRRIPMSEIPTESEEETTNWLYNLYKEKDQFLDDYFKTGTFPGKCIKLRRNPKTLVNTVFWCIAVGVPFLYFICRMLTTGNPWITACTVVGLMLLLTAVRMLIGVTKADKGSTYGKTATANDSTQNGVIENEVNQSNAERDKNSAEADVNISQNNSEQLVHKRKTVEHSES